LIRPRVHEEVTLSGGVMRLMPFLPVLLFYACIPLHAQQSPPAVRF
jgi:hypothetical protein